MLHRLCALAGALILSTCAWAAEDATPLAAALCATGVPATGQGATPAGGPYPEINRALALLATAASTSALPGMRVENRERYLPDQGPVQLLVFAPPVIEPVGPDAKATQVNYRVIVVPALADGVMHKARDGEGFAPMLLKPAQVIVEAATTGPEGTDWKATESSEPKTLLTFTASTASRPWWTPARAYVIGCAGAGGASAAFYGMLDTEVSSRRLAWWGAWGACAVLYLLAALGTYVYRQHQNRRRQSAEGKGTHHASLLRHLDPVMLTADGNGHGSATKLQILFFTVVVFWVAAYIWMRTGRLISLSNTVLMLIGISGVGAAVAGGTDLKKNRITFENWAWMIQRGWLPKGGVAEVHLASWRDIVTANNNEFDVYRFQMVIFSLLVGLSLLQVGIHLDDLGSFAVPEPFLYILGISQAVYVAGKLVAPPTMSELDAQLTKLQKQEQALREAVDGALDHFDREADLLLVEDESLRKARVAYSDYLASWNATSIMFSETLGREMPAQAEDRRPPFHVPQAFQCEQRLLDPAYVGEDYAYTFRATGGSGAYSWKMTAGRLPEGFSPLGPDGVLRGHPREASEAGRYEIQVQVADQHRSEKAGRFVLEVRPAREQRAGAARRPVVAPARYDSRTEVVPV